MYPIIIYGDILLAHSSALFREYTCQLSHRHYAWVSHLWTSGIGLMRQFLAPDSQIQTNCSLKCYYDQILDYHFFSLDWQFSTWSTWCANYSFIRLRKVVFFCAQKPLVFVRHYNAMFLWPGYQEHKTIALWRHFLNAVYTAWQISWKNPAQTKFPFLPLRCVLV